MKHPRYIVFGVAVILVAAIGELRGFTLMHPDESRVESPRSIRENPGAYRPIYRGTGGRYMRGK